MAILFTLFRADRDYSASADGGAKFFVGRRVPYLQNIGLYNIFRGSKLEKLVYSAADFPAHGFWSEFIEPTALCEGGSFLTLNTYDRAAFTFGFSQFAAHVKDGDFVKYFRAMLGLPNAADYFPHLAVVGGRICKTDGAAPAPLETAESTKDLMAYLNPDLSEVQDSEAIAAAKLIHWTSTTPAARELQVTHTINTLRANVQRAHKRVGLEGKTADICCVIADVLHQGRAGGMTWPLIDAAVKSTAPLKELLAIGDPAWRERTTTLGKAIAARPAFATRKWQSSTSTFV